MCVLLCNFVYSSMCAFVWAGQRISVFCLSLYTKLCVIVNLFVNGWVFVHTVSAYYVLWVSVSLRPIVFVSLSLFVTVCVCLTGVSVYPCLYL